MESVRKVGYLEKDFDQFYIDYNTHNFIPFLYFCFSLRIIQLLNQLCNESQLDDEVRRDACYGCFFRASGQPTGYPMLLNMASCADTYLNNTSYGHCQSYLRVFAFIFTLRSIPRIIATIDSIKCNATREFFGKIS